MSKLILARHHESEWNKKGLWTGLTDVELTSYGIEKSKEMGELLMKTYPDLRIDQAFASELIRTTETLMCMLKAMSIDPSTVPTTHSPALDERDYGDYTGKNKWDIEKKLGVDAFDSIRREWDHPVPHGETLKMVSARAVPFFTSTILPLLEAGKNILVVSHGNTERTLVKHLENISDDDVKNLEIPFGSMFVYDIGVDGAVIDKKILQVDSSVNA